MARHPHSWAAGGWQRVLLRLPIHAPAAPGQSRASRGRTWPRWLRGKWLAGGLLLLFFWAYEAFNIWASPWLTAWVALAYFVAAFFVDGVFKGAAFCKYVCPIGQFNFVNSLVSPFEVAVRDAGQCTTCKTKDCIRGRPVDAPPLSSLACGVQDAAPQLVNIERESPRLRGCELWLFQEKKVGNLDCTFCLDCVHACPHDNVGILARAPFRELWEDPRRSSICLLSRRRDVAALILLLVFTAYVNVFGMVTPVYPLESAIGTRIGSDTKPPVIVVLFVGLLLLWVLALGGRVTGPS